MELNFDIRNVELIEFGVGIDDGGKQSFVNIPVDTSVQTVLQQMVQSTWEGMQKIDSDPLIYNPAEKHGSIEYLYIPLDDDLASAVRELHEAAQLDLDGNGLNDPSVIFCYFAKMKDNKKKRLTALRRATQFKGVLKKKLIQFLDDSLKVVNDKIFKLDNDFDLLIDSNNVHILRPSGFEFAGQLKQAILDAVPQHIETIKADIAFVDFDGIKEYAQSHPRAARYLASICGQNETRNIDRVALKNLCQKTGVEIKEANGKLQVSKGHEMGFLEVLDRRRYEIELVKDNPERFRATSRSKIQGGAQA